jgi:hypothetical protein
LTALADSLRSLAKEDKRVFVYSVGSFALGRATPRAIPSYSGRDDLFQGFAPLVVPRQFVIVTDHERIITPHAASFLRLIHAERCVIPIR